MTLVSAKTEKEIRFSCFEICHHYMYFWLYKLDTDILEITSEKTMLSVSLYETSILIVNIMNSFYKLTINKK